MGILHFSLCRQLPVHHPLEVQSESLLQALGVGVLDAGVGAVDVVAGEDLLVAAQLAREESVGVGLRGAVCMAFIVAYYTENSFSGI